ncbi:hypothetical protein ACS0TY_019497 [Phlomoides rotata]
MRPIFCGNLDFDARQSEIERLFKRYGRVDRVDMKSGFAFVYMEDERDAEDAIRKLDRIDFGRKGRRLRVEWTKQERGGRRPDSSRKSSANSKPSKTLFVINFDPVNTRTRDIERHFEHYGKISNVRIRRNFAFVQYELQEDATRALETTHMSKFMDRVISVEYAIRDDDDKRNGYSPDRRGRDASPDGRGYGRRDRSGSPYSRDRGSPDYGHGALPNSQERRSPDYARADSPTNDRYPSRSPPLRKRSPPLRERGERSPPLRERGERSPPLRERGERSPPLRERGERSPPLHERGERSPPLRERGERSPPLRERGERSPPLRERGERSPPLRERGERSPPLRERGERSPPLREKGERSPRERGERSPPLRERSRS